MPDEHTFKESPDMNDDRSQHSDNASISSDSDPIVPKGMLPEYLAEAVGELYAEDGLLVLGKGLGCLQLIASFVRFYADTKEGHLACLAEEQDDDVTSKKKPPTRREGPSLPSFLYWDCVTLSEVLSLRYSRAGGRHQSCFPPL